MYRLQILFNKQGDWENTVWLPMDQMKALNLMAYYNKTWSHVHCYRLLKVGE